MAVDHDLHELAVVAAACQVELLNRDQVAEALSAWRDSTADSLRQFLVESSLLEESDWKHLEALVDRRRSSPPSAAQQTDLDALIHSFRSMLTAGGTPARRIHTTVGSAANVAAAVEPRTEPWRALADEHETRFQVLRPHAEGGLGKVSVALDMQVPREVALKEIQERYADDPVARDRFLQEAEITGGLEHPGIVPVYALGVDGMNRPYYAMRLIRGSSFAIAVDRYWREHRSRREPLANCVEFRNLLTRFIAACQAIDYAHSRRILHRDLKPANIMVGDHGETLVVDWGLARPVAASTRVGSTQPMTGNLPPLASTREVAPTLAGSVVGTPEFMSPEQAEGRLDLLSPQTDIYGLGATLYYLLTGATPVSGDSRPQVLERVRAGDIPPPRDHNRRVPRPLQAVCLKAMALRPSDRYATPAELAEEIERWLADEPVLAAPDSTLGKLRRWTRRHRRVVAVAFVSLLALLATLSISLAVVSHERNVARTQRLQADRSRTAAELNASITRDVLDKFLLKIGDDAWSRIPQFESFRIEMVEYALYHYDRLQRETPGDDALDADYAMALRRCANLYRMVNRWDQAGPLYEQSGAIYERLLSRSPDDATLQLPRLELLMDATNLQIRRQGAQAAASRVLDTLNAARQLQSQFPRRPAHDLACARAELACSSALLATGDHARAVELAVSAAETFSAQATPRPNDTPIRLYEVIAWNNLAATARGAGRQPLADEASRKATTLSQALWKLDSEEPNIRFMRASTLVERALVRHEADPQAADVEPLLDEAVRILDQLAEDFPQTASNRRRLAETLVYRALWRLSHDQADSALPDAQRAVDLLSQLNDGPANSAQYIRGLGLARAAQGEALARQGAQAEARTALEQARDLLAQAAHQAPGNREVQQAAKRVEQLLR